MAHHKLTDKDGFQVDEFILKVQMGFIPHASYIWKFGYSDINTPGVQNTIWDHNAGIYPYNLDYGINAKQVDLVSDTPIDDNGLEVQIVGLDADGYDQSEIVLIGQTSTLLYSRIFRARNHNGVLIVGEVNIYVTTTIDIVAHLDLASQATLMSVYTIPKGKVGFLHKGSTSIGSGKEAKVDWMIRQYGHVFTIGERLALYQNVVEADRPFIPIPELSDIEVRFTPLHLNTAISANMGIVLLDLEHFDLSQFESF